VLRLRLISSEIVGSSTGLVLKGGTPPSGSNAGGAFGGVLVVMI
jgi:hypothetical protein